MQFSPAISAQSFSDDEIEDTSIKEFSIHRSEYKKLLLQYQKDLSKNTSKQ
jgi:hypothetical protein